MGISNLERNLLALLGLKGIGPAAIKKNLGKIHVSVVEQNPLEALAPIFGNKFDEGGWTAAVATADRALETCGAAGITVLSIYDPRYPALLKAIGTPPPVLFCRGNVALLGRSALGVIGTRKPTAFGETVAGRIGSYFSGQHIPLCNGLAEGIDVNCVAPNGAMLPRVVGVMAAGLDLVEAKLSSKRTTELAAKVLKADGVLVSELPPGTAEDQNTVITSCRIQAGLSQVLLLVQSTSDGGSRFAVEHFCKLPRKLAYIVPPEAHAGDATFAANVLLSQGKAGLAEFVGLKTTNSLQANLIPISSKVDYDSVLKEFGADKMPII